MPKKKKLNLEALKVDSLVTEKTHGGVKSGLVCLTISATTIAVTKTTEHVPAEPVDNSQSHGRLYCPSDSTCN